MNEIFLLNLFKCNYIYIYEINKLLDVNHTFLYDMKGVRPTSWCQLVSYKKLYILSLIRVNLASGINGISYYLFEININPYD